jgi:thioredoxin 2
MVSPAFERLATEYAGRVKLVKVNVDSARKVSERFGAQRIPTLLLMDHARVVSEQVGALPESALRSWLEEGLARIAHTARSDEHA